MAKAKFTPGDLVELKSGGPVMTVEKEGYEQDTWGCTWFAGDKHQQNTFSGVALKLADI
ncbi:YodC family protein [Allopontixanthobacter sediminis]|uniref:DUF2158 domain-containing protein n=1 Tax=Allopontixanthobacter sediminis TaxID=1689985 RepID=A0A845AYR2_9SPHN|nr:DUF2158 domain-containing protein [Allopontixanthobacter sediminis]MXP43066.1 DUF2158 domain-containing protein [Allopontixanthobacter sediminis]